MNTPHALIHQLEAYAQEELNLQSRLLEALRAQEGSLFSGELESMRTNLQLVDEQLRGSGARAQRRHDLLCRLGAHFGVAQDTLTLTGICLRLGSDGARLSRLAAELRTLAQAVTRSTRRLAALARMHVRLNDDILGAVLAGQGVDAQSLQGTGALVNAEV